jgi:hypothetical protein
MTGTLRETLRPQTAFGRSSTKPSRRSRQVLRLGRYGRRARRYVFPRYPFSLVYIFRDGDVEVVAVAHGRRRPGYWRSRLRDAPSKPLEPSGVHPRVDIDRASAGRSAPIRWVPMEIFGQTLPALPQEVLNA